MKHLALPFIWIAILADAWFWQHYDSVSVDTFWTGETSVYLTWVVAFLVYVKFPPTENEKKLITLTLWAWIPFCANAIYRQQTGHGSEKSPFDLYSGFISLGIVIWQFIAWWYKAKKNVSNGQ